MKNIALIGHGYWGKKLEKYIPAFFNLRHVCDSATDLSTIWNDVEAVIVATPIETHYDVACEALKHKKHVFCEKPITLRVDQAKALEAKAKKVGVKIGVEYTFQFSLGIQNMLKELPTIGEIQDIEMCSKHLGRFMEHNVYWLLASHYMAVLDQIVDLNTLNFSSVDYVKNGDVVTTGTLFFEGAKVGAINVSVNYPGKDNRVTIYGEDGTIQFNPLEGKLEVTQYKKTPMALPPELTQYHGEYYTDEKNNLELATRYFKDLIDGKAESNIDTAIKITKILEELA